jgi:hypothetical protein
MDGAGRVRAAASDQIGKALIKMALRLSSGLVVLLFSLITISCFSSAQDRARLDEVKRIWTAFPLYPQMQEVDTSTGSGFGKAFISRTFRCKTSYEVVKGFYLERLGEDGWQFAGERQLKDWGRDVGGRELKFRRGEYEATIDYAGEKADYGWDYGIGIGLRQ